MEGGGGDFRAAGIFFVIKFLVWTFFRPYHEYFLGLIGMDIFFSFNFPLRQYFFVLRPPFPAPRPNKFSNGPFLRSHSFSSVIIIQGNDAYQWRTGVLIGRQLIGTWFDCFLQLSSPQHLDGQFISVMSKCIYLPVMLKKLTNIYSKRTGV